MTWEDAQDLADALHELHPDEDVLSLRFATLRRWVMELEGFEGDPADCNEKILEAIQMAWYDLVS
ncbi:Fe-S cluster assembly protein IscX [Tumebacillus lipolyticus]|uniref:Fe-S cluster assembly protein IscX n=1 Tax=Tumebacillus lipolyticus TaxID=1280370 RepID=A0ABW4ZTV6_9BACL